MFYKRFFSFYQELWIDAVDLGKEGQWMWFSSGRNVSSSVEVHCSSGPNNYKSMEHCVLLSWHIGVNKVGDMNCHGLLFSLCEKIIHLEM